MPPPPTAASATAPPALAATQTGVATPANPGATHAYLTNTGTSIHLYKALTLPAGTRGTVKDDNPYFRVISHGPLKPQVNVGTEESVDPHGTHMQKPFKEPIPALGPATRTTEKRLRDKLPHLQKSPQAGVPKSKA